MIDPRFVNAGAVTLVSGFGTQQAPVQYHHHHRRHHRHNKQKVRNDESPLSRDESIHKVDHGQHNLLQNNDVPLGSGYGVPYAATGFNAGGVTGFSAGGAAGFGVGGVPGFGTGGAAGFQQQQQYGAGNFGYANQYQSAPYGQAPFTVAPVGQTVRQHRHHRRHHRQHNVEAVNTAAQEGQGQTVPEQLIGQRSSSVVNEEEKQTRSPPSAPAPAPAAEDEVSGEAVTQRQHRYHQHQSGEYAGFGQGHKSRQIQGHTSAGADGYGHINEDLIFIERGDHSPHRQGAPAGYEYKGKIEVQGIDREYRSRSHGRGTAVQPPAPIPQPIIPPVSNLSLCPPGWQQMVMSAAPGGPCPPGAVSYTGQAMGSVGMTQPGIGGFGTGQYGVGSFGVAGVGGGYANFGAGVSYPSQCQYMADYIFGTNTGGMSTSSGTGFTPAYQNPIGTTAVTEQFQDEQVEEHVSGRPTIIEVWQRRSKSEKREKSRSKSRSPPRHRSRSRTPPPRPRHRSSTPTTRSSFDFDRFRREILSAIEGMTPRTGIVSIETQPTGRDGGTQTQIRPSPGGETQKERERRQETTSGEVRVIVQPIQPVFYMPRQTGGTVPPKQPEQLLPPIGPTPVIPQPIPSGAPNVVYVPRNVYVPVIKPVFVPRERVIVRPQVIHVARPVLVDRPVPVTQRPIIIDRERPIPVPVRGGGQVVGSAASEQAAREEYVYRDNLPVAYGGRCAEFAGGVNYGYMPTQQEHQYATSSTHEAPNIYQTQAPDINVNVTDQFQHSQSGSHFESQQGVCADFHGSYSNLAGTSDSFGVGMNNEYLARQQEQQYANSSTHETGNVYQTEGSVVNVNVPNQFHHSQSASQLEMQQGGIGLGGDARSFHESYSNLVGGTNATAVNLGQHNQDILRQTLEQSAQAAGLSAHGPTQIEILDTAVNPFWQKTDQSTLMRRYGRPAFEIVHKSEEVEQQMYNELRQRTSSSGVVRSASTASYGSGSGIGVNGSGMAQY